MEVGAYEAKTHLAALLDRVERGERITILRRGRPVAVLVPPPGGRERPVRDAVAEIRSFRAGQRLGEGLTARDLVDEGRR
jgi:prevent-host-death family protein